MVLILLSDFRNQKNEKIQKQPPKIPFERISSTVPGLEKGTARNGPKDLRNKGIIWSKFKPTKVGHLKEVFMITSNINVIFSKCAYIQF